MTSKFMANTAFEAHLFLRRPHQRTVSFVNKHECPFPGRPRLPPILSYRSYSDSTSTPPFPKSSESTKGSQSSRPKYTNWSFPKTWDKVRGWVTALGLGAAVVTFAGYVTQEMWKEWYQSSQIRERESAHESARESAHESARESAIYDMLKKGPVFDEIEYSIPRQPLVEKIRKFTTPGKKSGAYPVIIGEHGTGKTSLIQLALNGMDEPKGVVYVDIPIECGSQVDVTKAMQSALGWSPDPLIDSSQPASLGDALQLFSSFAMRYKHEYEKVPVLIIDNANRLAEKQPELLDLFQDYAKAAADRGVATVVFVSSEGRVPRRMTERSAWSRRGQIIEIGDMSEQETLQYLNLRNIDGKQAAQIYKLVGGRIISLKFIADIIEKNGSFEDMRKTIFFDVKSQLKSAQILPDRRYHKAGAKVIRELLAKGSIPENTYYRLVGAEIGDKLLEANVFSFRFSSQEVTFQSTATKRYCEENLAFWEEK